MCSELTIKTPERCHRRRSGVFIVTFEHISHLFLVFLLLTLYKYMFAGNVVYELSETVLAKCFCLFVSLIGRIFSLQLLTSK